MVRRQRPRLVDVMVVRRRKCLRLSEMVLPIEVAFVRRLMVVLFLLMLLPGRLMMLTISKTIARFN